MYSSLQPIQHFTHVVRKMSRAVENQAGAEWYAPQIPGA
jgi:hypothetical protein